MGCFSYKDKLHAALGLPVSKLSCMSGLLLTLPKKQS